MSRQMTADEIRAALAKNRNSLTAYEGHNTRDIRRLEATVDLFARGVGDPSTEKDARDLCARLAARAVKMEELLKQNQRMSDDNTKAALEQEINELHDRIDRVTLESKAIMNQWRKDAGLPVRDGQNPAGGQAAGNAAPVVKIATEAKPSMLNSDATPAELDVWIRRLKFYWQASNLDKAPTTVQRGHLLNLIDETLISVIDQDVPDDQPVLDYGRPDMEGEIIDRLRRFFREKHPVLLRRRQFLSIRQKDGQAFTETIREIKNAAKSADMQTITWDQLQIVVMLLACKEKELQEQLLKEPLLTVFQVESIASRYYEIKNANGGVAVANRVGDKKPREKPKGDAVCIGCGKNHRRSDCPHKDTTCNHCGRKGHLKSVCRQLKAEKEGSSKPGKARAVNEEHAPAVVQQQQPENSQTSYARVVAPEFCRAVVRLTGGDNSTPRIQLKLTSGRNSFNFAGVADTGASKTVVSENILKRNGISWQDGNAPPLYAANNQRLRCPGMARLEMRPANGGVPIDIEAIVCRDMRDEILISYLDLKAMGAIEFKVPVCARAAQVDISPEQVKQTLLKEFPDVLKDDLDAEPMNVPPVKIELRTDIDIVPTRCFQARQPPLHLRGEAEAILNDLVTRGIIEPVNYATDWTSASFFVPKSNGGLRLVTDFTGLCEQSKRREHPFPSQKDIANGIRPDSTVFLHGDAKMGYHQIELHEDSRDLTTFMTFKGRYRYRRLAAGLHLSGDVFNVETDELISGIEGSYKIVDDCLLQTPSGLAMLAQGRVLFSRCRDKHVIMSRSKFEVGHEITFAGFVVGRDGVKPDPDKIKSLVDFPTPKCPTDVRSFLGLVTQLAHFAPDVTHHGCKLRDLTKKNNAFVWTPAHQADFDKMKQLITCDSVVKPFDTKRTTLLITDASRLGLAFLLVQSSALESKDYTLVQCGSTKLTPAQENYAVVELEALAVQWAMEKCDYFLRGMSKPFYSLTDHQALVSIFKQPLSQIANPRLLRIRMKTLKYRFQMLYIAGKSNLMSDSMSRAPVFDPDAGSKKLDAAHVALVYRVAPTNQSCGKLLEHAQQDEDYQKLVTAISDPNFDVSNSDRQGHPAASYKKVWQELSVMGKDADRLVVFDGHRLIVPRAMRKEVIEGLHKSHCGTARAKKMAAESYMWPGMNKEIEDAFQQCEPCAKFQPSTIKPAIIDDVTPAAPMTDMSADHFEHAGRYYFVAVCRFSGWPFCEPTKSLSTQATINILKSIFNAWGYCCTLRTDGAPAFRQEFTTWCTAMGIRHEVTAPYSSVSNGPAEAAVKVMKLLLKKTLESGEDFQLALLAYRNTPKATGFSCAQLFLGRRLKGMLPVLTEHLRYDAGMVDTAHASREVAKAKARSDYNESAIEPLPLAIGTRVRVQDVLSKGKPWRELATVKHRRDGGHAYIVEFQDGRTALRSRRHLRPANGSQPEEPQETPPTGPVTRSKATQMARSVSFQPFHEHGDKMPPKDELRDQLQPAPKEEATLHDRPLLPEHSRFNPLASIGPLLRCSTAAARSLFNSVLWQILCETCKIFSFPAGTVAVWFLSHSLATQERDTVLQPLTVARYIFIACSGAALVSLVTAELVDPPPLVECKHEVCRKYAANSAKVLFALRKYYEYLVSIVAYAASVGAALASGCSPSQRAQDPVRLPAYVTTGWCGTPANELKRLRGINLPGGMGTSGSKPKADQSEISKGGSFSDFRSVVVESGFPQVGTGARDHEHSTLEFCEKTVEYLLGLAVLIGFITVLGWMVKKGLTYCKRWRRSGDRLIHDRNGQTFIMRRCLPNGNRLPFLDIARQQPWSAPPPSYSVAMSQLGGAEQPTDDYSDYAALDRAIGLATPATAAGKERRKQAYARAVEEYNLGKGSGATDDTEQLQARLDDLLDRQAMQEAERERQRACRAAAGSETWCESEIERRVRSNLAKGHASME